MTASLIRLGSGAIAGAQVLGVALLALLAGLLLLDGSPGEAVVPLVGMVALATIAALRMRGTIGQAESTWWSCSVASVFVAGAWMSAVDGLYLPDSLVLAACLACGAGFAAGAIHARVTRQAWSRFAIAALLPALALGGTWLGHAQRALANSYDGWAFDPMSTWLAWERSAYTAAPLANVGTITLLALVVAGLCTPTSPRGARRVAITLSIVALAIGIAAGANSYGHDGDVFVDELGGVVSSAG